MRAAAIFSVIWAVLLLLIILLPIRIRIDAAFEDSALRFGTKIGFLCGAFPLRFTEAIEYREGRGPVFCGSRKNMGRPVFAERTEKQKNRAKRRGRAIMKNLGSILSSVSAEKFSVKGARILRD